MPVAPLPRLGNKKMSPGIIGCPLGGKIHPHPPPTPGWEALLKTSDCDSEYLSSNQSQPGVKRWQNEKEKGYQREFFIEWNVIDVPRLSFLAVRAKMPFMKWGCWQMAAFFHECLHLAKSRVGSPMSTHSFCCCRWCLTEGNSRV